MSLLIFIKIVERGCVCACVNVCACVSFKRETSGENDLTLLTWTFALALFSVPGIGSVQLPAAAELQLSSVLEPQFLKPSPPRLHVILERFSASFLAVSSPCGSDIPPNLPFIGPICLIRLCVIAGTGLNVRFGGQPVSLPLPINTLDKMLGSS